MDEEKNNGKKPGPPQGESDRPDPGAKKGAEGKPAERSPKAGEERSDKPSGPPKGEEGKPAKPRPAAASTGKAEPGGEKPEPKTPDAEEKPAAEAKPTPEKPAAKPAPGKPTAKPAKKPPVRRPVKRGPSYEDLEDDPLLDALKERFDDAVLSGQTFLDQSIYTVAVDALYDVMLFLRDQPEWDFDYLVDMTALDYLGDEKRFCLVYQLYSYPDGPLIRVKSRIAEGAVAPSMTSIWATADWLEREVYDMFGIEFSGHPNMRRILLPDDWHGFPLRKDYDIKLQDQAWIRKHLRIRKVPS